MAWPRMRERLVMLWRKGWRPGALLLVGLVLGAGAVRAYYADWPRTLDPYYPGQAEAERYFAKEFKPRYRRGDCITRMDFTYSGDGSDVYPDDPNVILFSDFRRHLFANEPKAALFYYRIRPRVGKARALYLLLANECDRRFEIAQGLADMINARHRGRFRMTVSVEKIEPGPDTIEISYTDTLWLEGGE